MKNVVLGTLLAGLMVTGFVGLTNAAEEETPTQPATPPTEVITPPAPPVENVAPPQPATAPASIERLKEKVDAINAAAGTGTRMQDVVKLVKAGVNTGVIETYVRNSRIPAPTPEDLVYLHEQGVPEDIVKALIEHGQSAKASGTSAVGAPGQTDPQQVAQPGVTYNNYVNNPPAQNYVYNAPSQTPQIVTYPDYSTTGYYQNNSSLLIIPYNPYRNYGYYSSPFYSGYYAPPYYSYGYGYGYGCGPYRYYGSYYGGSYYRGGYYHGGYGHYGGGLHVYRR